MLTTTDAKRLFRIATTSLAINQLCPYIELLSGAGVITEKHARSEIFKLITGPGRTSIYAVASELSIDPHTAERLLPAETELGGWGRYGASTIIKTTEFEHLKLQLKEELSRDVVSTVDFCRRHQIDTKLLMKLLPVSEEWEWLGNGNSALYGKSYYSHVKMDILTSLGDTERPVELRSLDPSSVAFARKIAGDVLREGLVKGLLEGDKFIPDAFIQKRHRELVEELRTDGVIAMEILRRERVVDPEGLVKHHFPDGQLLVSCFVTYEFIRRMENSILESVNEKGWGDIKDIGKQLPIEDEKLLLQIVLKALPTLHNVSGTVMSQDLVAQLEAKFRKLSHERAEDAWRRRSKENPTNSMIKSHELMQLLGSEKSLAPALLSHFTNTLLPYTTLQFNHRFDEVRQAMMSSAKAAFFDKYSARFCIHLKSLDSIRDLSLRSKLEVDLVQYAKENGVRSVEKLEIALVEDPSMDLQPLHHLKVILQQRDVETPKNYLKSIDRALRVLEMGVSIESTTLETKKIGLMEEINSQLQTSESLSLALLSTLLLIHANNRDGVLKATGKYVPKLLKEVQGAGLITEEQFTLMEKVKAAAQGKNDISIEDMAQLRSIGTRCVG